MTGAGPRGRRSVVLMGAGGIGRSVAVRLAQREDISLRVIERNPGRAQELANRVPAGVMVLVGDATDLDLLLEERIGEANLFVATSDDDERNMVACQLARSLGAERTIALVNKALLPADLRPARHRPGHLAAHPVRQPDPALRAHAPRSPRSPSIGEGKAEVLEVEARFRKGSARLKNLDLPRGTLVGAVVRADEVVIPNGEHRGRGRRSRDPVRDLRPGRGGRGAVPRRRGRRAGLSASRDDGPARGRLAPGLRGLAAGRGRAGARRPGGGRPQTTDTCRCLPSCS